MPQNATPSHAGTGGAQEPTPGAVIPKAPWAAFRSLFGPKKRFAEGAWDPLGVTEQPARPNLRLPISTKLPALNLDLHHKNRLY